MAERADDRKSSSSSDEDDESLRCGLLESVVGIVMGIEGADDLIR